MRGSVVWGGGRSGKGVRCWAGRRKKSSWVAGDGCGGQGSEVKSIGVQKSRNVKHCSPMTTEPMNENQTK